MPDAKAFARRESVMACLRTATWIGARRVTSVLNMLRHVRAIISTRQSGIVREHSTSSGRLSSVLSGIRFCYSAK